MNLELKESPAVDQNKSRICNQLRKLAQDNFNKHLYESAAFFADKLVQSCAC